MFTFPVTLYSGGKFSPASIPGLKLWLDSSNASSITQSGGKVSQWNDLSGNANHAVQATGASQPTTGVGTQNGLNTLGFGGTQSMQSPLVISTATFAVVGKNAAAGQAFVEAATAGGVNTVWALMDESSNYKARRVSGTDAQISDTGLVGNYNLFAGQVQNSSGILAINIGTSNTNAGAQTIPTSTNMLIGGLHGFYPLNGNIAEIVVYSGILSALQITLLQNYLRTKWGTP